MNRRFQFGLLLVILIAVVSLCVGAVAFNAGLAQGVAQSVQAGDGAPYRYAPYFFARPWGFGFGFGGIILFFLLLFLGFGLVRFFLRGGPFGWRRMNGGPAGWGDKEHRVPPFFEEWHRQAHASETPKQEDKSST